MDEDFVIGLEKFLDGFVNKTSLQKALSMPSLLWGWTDKKNFSHGWLIGFLEGISFVHFIDEYHRMPDVEEEERLLKIVQKYSHKINEMIQREFELSIIEKSN